VLTPTSFFLNSNSTNFSVSNSSSFLSSSTPILSNSNSVSTPISVASSSRSPTYLVQSLHSKSDSKINNDLFISSNGKNECSIYTVSSSSKKSDLSSQSVLSSPFQKLISLSSVSSNMNSRLLLTHMTQNMKMNLLFPRSSFLSLAHSRHMNVSSSLSSFNLRNKLISPISSSSSSE